ncbi:hypothetical protein C5B85_08545 [Pseudoclavibacter sp. AY1F1]|uniref:hypothetical protein n=1 Tax=Pseudoclavibacter sp. AY1F1 TaxID=2080583 RepID=UPI000CE7AAF8|nr:hypothetical protein [Pseudoclavibacter sp. AY1F1]PPF44786.1 hypothetical protein C5B85_08545 [Pseudoclavibacter sp. AY1F1]
MNPKQFVMARLAEGALPPAVELAYRRLLRVAEEVVSGGEEDDIVDWLLGADEEEKALEYLFGADPASEGERLSLQLIVTLAATWEPHPEFDPKWRGKLPGEGAAGD